MRFSFLIFCVFIGAFANAQKTIKVRKGRTLHGFYQLQTENKIKEFLYFDNNGNIAIITSKNRKKALYLLSCDLVSEKLYMIVKNVIEVVNKINTREKPSSAR